MLGMEDAQPRDYYDGSDCIELLAGRQPESEPEVLLQEELPLSLLPKEVGLPATSGFARALSCPASARAFSSAEPAPPLLALQPAAMELGCPMLGVEDGQPRDYYDCCDCVELPPGGQPDSEPEVLLPEEPMLSQLAKNISQPATPALMQALSRPAFAQACGSWERAPPHQPGVTGLPVAQWLESHLHRVTDILCGLCDRTRVPESSSPGHSCAGCSATRTSTRCWQRSGAPAAGASEPQRLGIARTLKRCWQRSAAPTTRATSEPQRLAIARTLKR